jgi:hypothetical protein
MLFSFFADDEPVSIIVHVPPACQKQISRQQSASLIFLIIVTVLK